MSAAEYLPLTETRVPAGPTELADVVREACAQGMPVYPLGGGTSLDYGLPATRPGWGLSLSQMNRVIDYPARDLTVTVESGVTLAQLAHALAAERQQLPLDMPSAEKATVGGMVATNWNGPRRYGHGTVRDYVIGISAVDAAGKPFKGGGRVVKNVAGYDFCKLLTGSLGTLAIITQVTFKVKPLPERFAMLACRVPNLAEAEARLAALAHSRTTPAAIELLGGPAWLAEPALAGLASENEFVLAVALEGTSAEVSWMIEQLHAEWSGQGVHEAQTLATDKAQALWRRLIEFSAEPSAPLVLKAVVRPSGVTPFMAAALEASSQCSLQAHAGSGVVLVRCATFPKAGLARMLMGTLKPAAAAHCGHVTVLSNPSGGETTPQGVWGSTQAPFALMAEIKKQFDPQNRLNPGRFVYA